MIEELLEVDRLTQGRYVEVGSTVLSLTAASSRIGDGHTLRDAIGLPRSTYGHRRRCGQPVWVVVAIAASTICADLDRVNAPVGALPN
jgi:hypothetical protein